MGDLAAQRKNVAREYRDDGEKTADHCKSLLTEIWRDWIWHVDVLPDFDGMEIENAHTGKSGAGDILK